MFDILDRMVAKNDPKKKIIATAKLAKRRLNLNGMKRPTMKQVVTHHETSSEIVGVD